MASKHTARESVMLALAVREYDGVKIIGSSDFGWMGMHATVPIVMRGDDNYRFEDWPEVESCVASMIAAHPRAARVL